MLLHGILKECLQGLLYLKGRETLYVVSLKSYKYRNPNQDPFQGADESTYYLLTKSPRASR